MTESTDDPPGGRPPGLRIHPLDLLVLVLASGLAALAYAYLFRRSPAARPVDPYLGAIVEVEFKADRPWKERFPGTSKRVEIEEFLASEVVERRVVHPGPPPTVVLRLHVLRRGEQRPEAITLFRNSLRRGSVVRIASDPAAGDDSVLQGEVVGLELNPEGR